MGTGRPAASVARVRGTELARAYFDDVVGPLIEKHLPGIRYAAARLGSGSDVLGLDDEMSQDHDFGLRLTLLPPAGQVTAVRALLEARLPAEHLGRPTRFVTSWSAEPGVQVEVASAADFSRSRLGVDATRDLELTDWLALTGQAVLEVTAGPVFVDGVGELGVIRDRLVWYPDDVWRHLLACDWVQVAEELPFVGRAGSRGDDLGSRVIAARLAQVGMHLGFLLERQWPPYSKWLGTAFARLPRAAAAAPGLTGALSAETWQRREAGLAEAFSQLGRLQGELGLPSPEPVVVPFWNRPFRGIADVAAALVHDITDPQVRALPSGVGSAEQVSATTKVLVDHVVRRRLVDVVGHAGAMVAEPGPRAERRGDVE